MQHAMQADGPRQTWLRRMLPGVRFGGSPKVAGAAITMLPSSCPCRGAFSRPPGRTMV
jgi:hypothetical protein